MDLGKAKNDLKMLVLSKILVGWGCGVIMLGRV